MLKQVKGNFTPKCHFSSKEAEELYNSLDSKRSNVSIETIKSDHRPLLVVVSLPRCGSSLTMDICERLGKYSGPCLDSPLQLGIRRGRREILLPIFEVGRIPPNEELIRLVYDLNLTSLKLCRNIDNWLNYFDQFFEIRLIILLRDEQKRDLSAKWVNNIDRLQGWDKDNKLPSMDIVKKYPFIFVRFEQLIDKNESLIKRLICFIKEKNLNEWNDDDEKDKNFISNYMIDKSVVRFA